MHWFRCMHGGTTQQHTAHDFFTRRTIIHNPATGTACAGRARPVQPTRTRRVSEPQPAGVMPRLGGLHAARSTAGLHGGPQQPAPPVRWSGTAPQVPSTPPPSRPAAPAGCSSTDPVHVPRWVRRQQWRVQQWQVQQWLRPGLQPFAAGAGVPWAAVVDPHTACVWPARLSSSWPTHLRCGVAPPLLPPTP